MALNEMINTIRKAVYGRDVRQAIADGLQEINAIAEEAHEYATGAKDLSDYVKRDDLSNYVTSERKIAGLNLNNDITETELIIAIEPNLPSYLTNDTQFIDGIAKQLSGNANFAVNFALNETFGANLCRNNSFVTMLGENSEFLSKMSSNPTLLDEVEKGLKYMQNKLLIPRPSKGDVGKILYVSEEDTVEWRILGE